MSTLPRMFVALTICLVLPAAIGFLWDKPPVNDAHDIVVQLENKWLLAEDDPDALQPVLASDFVHALPMGFVNKDEQLHYLHTHRSGKGENRHFEGLRVRVYGTAAVVNGIVVASSGNGKVHKTLFTDVFAYRHGRWQAVNAQETPLADSPGQ